MKKEILGVKVDDFNNQQILEKVDNFLDDAKKHYLVTPNPEFLVAAQRDEEFKQILNEADIAIPDGIGVIIASVLLGRGIKNRITGTDLVSQLTKLASEKNYSIFLLGGRDGVAKRTESKLIQKYPNISIVGTYEGEADKTGDSETTKAIIEANRSGGFIDFLFVAYGQAKQEKWIKRNLGKIPVKVAVGVGGAFDYLSGKKPRAPFFLQKIGLEWLFRLLIEPWRFKRQLVLPYFIYLILKEAFSKSRSLKSGD